MRKAALYACSQAKSLFFKDEDLLDDLLPGGRDEHFGEDEQGEDEDDHDAKEEKKKEEEEGDGHEDISEDEADTSETRESRAGNYSHV